MDNLTSNIDAQDSTIPFTQRACCALCGNRQSTVHRDFRDIPVLRCSQCGFLYSSRTMDSEGMEAYYREDFGSRRHLQGQMVNARTNEVALERLLNFRQIRNWLDVGTGYGFLLQWLQRKHGIAAEGVELSIQEAQYARKQLGLNVHSNLISESGLPRGSFDVVSSFEVIEHIPEPVPFVEQLAEYVRPGGYLVIMTDNFESRAASRLKGSFPKWIPHTHVSHFGPATLRACAGQVSGLTLEKEASYTPWDLVGRQWVSVFRPPVADDQAYDLRDALSTEMQRKYKLFKLRYFTNPLWTRIDLRPTLDDGALMYLVCRKQS
jgi:SAM-dependent methyltransferase